MVYTVNELGRYDLDGGAWALLPQGGGYRVMFRSTLDAWGWDFVGYAESLHEGSRFILNAIANGAPARFEGTLPDNGR
jgi:hypothetical protein